MNNIQAQVEHLQSKYIGTGHADITKHDWLVNQHRDSISSYIGHPNLTSYFAIAQNLSRERVKTDLLARMIQPCGPPPK
jgi:splicing factor 3B subunit 5